MRTCLTDRGLPDDDGEAQIREKAETVAAQLRDGAALPLALDEVVMVGSLAGLL